MRPRDKKFHAWLKRYIPGEIIGTVFALGSALIVFNNSHSYITAAAAGWVGEGIGFYGYIIIVELIANHKLYAKYVWHKRILRAVSSSSSNLLVEFAPAEIIDNFVVRPYLMFIVPQYIKPFALGFLVGKFGADILFYVLAIIGYETRNKWLKRD